MEQLVICKFSDFAQAYTGLNSPDECMAFIEEQDQMWFVNSPAHIDNGNAEFLTETDMIAIWDSQVEIRVDGQMENNGVYILNLTVITPDANNPYNGSVVECDCEELEEILRDIIKS